MIKHAGVSVAPVPFMAIAQPHAGGATPGHQMRCSPLHDRAMFGSCPGVFTIHPPLLALQLARRFSRELGRETRKHFDRFLFVRVLEHTRGNYSAAGELLGISRQTMRMKLRAPGITVGCAVEQDDGTE
jgi:hypothetical protein